jgi:hypothetical protein
MTLLRLAVLPALAGQDRPIASGDTLYVSPAMAALVDGASDDELTHLLQNFFPMEIPLVDQQATDKRSTVSDALVDYRRGVANLQWLLDDREPSPHLEATIRERLDELWRELADDEKEIAPRVPFRTM